MSPSPDLSLHTQIEEERKAALPEAEMLKTFREYARGRQRSTLTPGQQRILTGILGNIFCDNVCKRVLQELRNRLRLARFSVSSGTDANREPHLEFLKTLWTLNQLGAFSAIVHWATLRDGNAAVGLRWIDDAARVQLVRETWWNGDNGIFVAYDDDNRPSYAVKDWVERTGLQRRTIWYPDRIQRYRHDGAGWRQYELPGDTAWPQPWVDRQEQPLGIPIVHFANLQLPVDGPGTDVLRATPGPQTHDASGVVLRAEPDPRYGASELDGGMIGIQDEVNDLHRDISAAARFAGYQMIWVTGTQPAIDEETGEEEELEVEPGAVFRDPNPDARFGVIAAGSIASLKDGLEIKLQAVSRMTSVPNHLISGNWPSGEAILRIETPLVDKVETIGQSVGPAWSSVAHKAILIRNTFSSESPLDPTSMISALFVNAARRDPMTLADVADRLSQHVGREETLVQLGYAPDDVKRIMAQMEAEIARFGSLVQRPQGTQPAGSTGAAGSNQRPGPQPHV